MQLPFRPKFDFCDENHFGADGFLAILIIPQGVALCYYLSPFQGSNPANSCAQNIPPLGE